MASLYDIFHSQGDIKVITECIAFISLKQLIEHDCWHPTGIRPVFSLNGMTGTSMQQSIAEMKACGF
jgi:hypothetical protein